MFSISLLFCFCDFIAVMEDNGDESADVGGTATTTIRPMVVVVGKEWMVPDNMVSISTFLRAYRRWFPTFNDSIVRCNGGQLRCS